MKNPKIKSFISLEPTFTREEWKAGKESGRIKKQIPSTR